MVAGRRHRSGLLSDYLHRGRSRRRHPIPVPGLEDASPPRPRPPCRDTACEPRWTRADACPDACPRPSGQPRAPGHPTPPGNFATIDGAISYAQQSGFSIINLFTEHTPLNDFREAVGAEIIYLVLSHIAEIDKNASVTVTGSAMDGALTLTISALTPEASVLGGRRMGEIRALIDSVSGSVETDEQVGAWSLTAHLDPPGSAPVPEETP